MKKYSCSKRIVVNEDSGLSDKLPQPLIPIKELNTVYGGIVEQRRGSDSLASLLSAVQRGRGYTMRVGSVSVRNGIVHVGLSEPERTAVMTEEAYNKIRDYIIAG